MPKIASISDKFDNETLFYHILNLVPVRQFLELLFLRKHLENRAFFIFESFLDFYFPTCFSKITGLDVSVKVSIEKIFC